MPIMQNNSTLVTLVHGLVHPRFFLLFLFETLRYFRTTSKQKLFQNLRFTSSSSHSDNLEGISSSVRCLSGLVLDGKLSSMRAKSDTSLRTGRVSRNSGVFFSFLRNRNSLCLSLWYSIPTGQSYLEVPACTKFALRVYKQLTRHQHIVA